MSGTDDLARVEQLISELARDSAWTQADLPGGSPLEDVMAALGAWYSGDREAALALLRSVAGPRDAMFAMFGLLCGAISVLETGTGLSPEVYVATVGRAVAVNMAERRAREL